jgi:hypothetical protein
MVAPRPTRRRHRGRRALLILVILLGLAVLLDWGARLATERIAEQRFQSSQNLSERPDISIGGWPFLTQLAARKFRDVRVHATGLVVHTDGNDVRIQTLDARLHGVVPGGDLASAHADSATGTVLVTYPDLSKVVGVDLSYAGGDKIRASKTVTVLGQKIDVSASASITINSDGSLGFSNVTTNLGNVQLPQQVTDLVTQALSKSVSLSGLPAGLKVTSVTADDAGVHAQLSAQNVTVS